jgi:peptidoglycan hydrolase-like protein with peptidoglycan-binding domain
VVAAGTLTSGAIMAGAAFAPAAHAATADDFARLRACESGGNYSTNTGNGFYGAYQFDLGTWHGLGYSGVPSNAAPGTQDAAARTLQSQRGWSPWPACSRRLGLGSSHSHQSYSSAASSHAVIVHVTKPNGMSTFEAGQFRGDVQQLQNDLVFIGYNLDIDGHFGQETDTVVRAFQQKAHLTVDGVAGPQTLKAVHHAKMLRWHQLNAERMRAI